MKVIKFIAGKLKGKTKASQKLVKEAQKLVFDASPNQFNPQTIIETLNKHPEFYTSQKPVEISYLMELIHNNQIKRICEIGAYRGGTLFLFSQSASPDAKIISVDIAYPKERVNAHQSFSRLQQSIVCIQGDTQDHKTFEKVRKYLRGEPLDLLFIDGDHSFNGVANDYVRFSPLVRKGGYIAFHDIVPDSYTRTGIKTPAYVGQVPQFWIALRSIGYEMREIIENPEQDGCGIGILIKD